MVSGNRWRSLPRAGGGGGRGDLEESESFGRGEFSFSGYGNAVEIRKSTVPGVLTWLGRLMSRAKELALVK
eukprot:7191033-Ditylum_brightwellii.AAC.1